MSGWIDRISQWWGGSEEAHVELREVRFILLGGVSGSGKSAACAAVGEGLRTIEMDPYLLDHGRDWGVSPEGGDPFLYRHWKDFLADDECFRRVMADLAAHVAGEVRAGGAGVVVLVANHYVVERFDDWVSGAVRLAGGGEPGRIALDVAPEVVLGHRRKRGNPYDLEVGLDRIRREVREMRERLGALGYRLVDEAGAVHLIQNG